MKTMTTFRFIRHLLACGAVLVALLLISPGVGTQSRDIGLLTVWRCVIGLDLPRDQMTGNPLVDHDSDGVISDEEYEHYQALVRTIAFQHRFPRAVLALIVGVTLAMCGVTFQTLFRNPLATPYTLGIASGGSLGALIAIRAGWHDTFAGVPMVTLAAFFGGLGVVGCVYAIARGNRRLTSNEVLLAGVTLGLFSSAMMMMVTAISSERETFRIVRWMMGSLDTISLQKPHTIWPIVVPVWVLLTLMSRSMNQYRLGDDIAAVRGVKPQRLLAASIMICTLATAAVVATCGPIGFVGLVVPHIAAMFVGQDCRLLIPAAGLLGGAFLILCDWASQLIMGMMGSLTGQQLAAATLPIGVITAVVGVPIFVTMLATRRMKT